MNTTRHSQAPAATAPRLRTLRLATALVAAVALTPAAIAEALPPQLNDGSAAPASAGNLAPATRPVTTGPDCPCNAGLPIGRGVAVVVPTAAPHPHVQRPGPGGPVGKLPTQAATPPAAAAEAPGSDGFDWIDAAAGAGVVAVLGGLVLAAGRMRARPLPG